MVTQSSFQSPCIMTWGLHSHRAMIVWVLLVVAYTIACTHGANCTENQHCSDCHSETGHCLVKCDQGFFDKKCRSDCSKNCKNNTCELYNTGIENCTEGCVTGYQGTNCQRPCDAQGDHCTKCPETCNGNYCQLGDSCISGCKDNHYGSGCSDCSYTCKSCKRMSGICEECHSPFFGLFCNNTFANCAGTNENGCAYCCLPGFYGEFCDKNCSKNCSPNSPWNTMALFEHDVSSSNYCRPICNKQSGECLHGCTNGWNGSTCSTQDPGCDVTGTCTTGQIDVVLQVGLSTPFGFLVLVTLVAIGIYYVKNIFRQTVKQTDAVVFNTELAEVQLSPLAYEPLHHNSEPTDAGSSRMEYASIHKYWEITESSLGSPGQEDEHDGREFAISRSLQDIPQEVTSSEDVVPDDQRRSFSYISAVEDSETL